MPEHHDQQLTCTTCGEGLAASPRRHPDSARTSNSHAYRDSDPRAESVATKAWQEFVMVNAGSILQNSEHRIMQIA